MDAIHVITHTPLMSLNLDTVSSILPRTEQVCREELSLQDYRLQSQFK